MNRIRVGVLLVRTAWTVLRCGHWPTSENCMWMLQVQDYVTQAAVLGYGPVEALDVLREVHERDLVTCYPYDMAIAVRLMAQRMIGTEE